MPRQPKSSHSLLGNIPSFLLSLSPGAVYPVPRLPGGAGVATAPDLPSARDTPRGQGSVGRDHVVRDHDE